MRRKNSDFEFKQQRDKNLLSVFYQVYSQSKDARLYEILKEVVDHKAERFWVSLERALIVVSLLKRGEDISYMKINRQRMYNEIYRRVIKMEKENPAMDSISVVASVIEQEAPSFYISSESANVIIFYIKKQRKCLRQKSSQLHYSY